MSNNLFGEKIEDNERFKQLKKSLLNHDKNTLGERLERLKYVDTIFPKNYSIAADFETVFIFNETKQCYCFK